MSKKEEFLSLLNKDEEDSEKKAKDFFFQNKEEIYQEDPIFTLDSCIALRLSYGEYGECYEDLEWFESKPYVSIVMEEKLMHLRKSLSKKIHEMEENKKREKEGKLKGKEGKSLLKAVLSLSKEEMKKEENTLIEFSQRKDDETLALASLLCLLQLKSDVNLTFTRKGKEYVINPSTALAPLMDESQKECEEYVKQYASSPSILNVAMEIIRAPSVFFYPLHPYEGKEELFGYSAVLLAHQMLLDKEGEALLLSSSIFPQNEVEKCVFFLKDTAFSFPS